MNLGQALACGIVYWLAEANVVYVTVWTIQKPLVCGWLTGMILGCPETGALCGALCSLMLITYRSTGSSMPGDPGLAGICASASAAALVRMTAANTGYADAAGKAGPLSGVVVCGIALLFALPAFFAGIPVWRLRLHVNRSFGERTEQVIRAGGRWRIFFPAVLQPAAFSACICIPAGAACSAMAFHAGRVLLHKTAAPASGVPVWSRTVLLSGAGLLLPLAGLLLLFVRQREKAGRAAFVCGAAAGILCFMSKIPFFIAAAVSIPVCVPVVRNLEKRQLQKQEKDRLEKEGLKKPPEEGGQPRPDPDFDPDFDLDPDFDPDQDPASAADLSGQGTGSGRSAGFRDLAEGRINPDFPGTPKQGETGRILSLPALGAANLLWILFVQTAYNTRRMMGQAAALAFLPVLEEICPGDPQGQQEILLRQCSYQNTQPEMGSCLLGRMIAMEACREDPGQIRIVRTALMGSFGAIGDELFQCGWIPALLLLFSELTFQSAGSGAALLVPAYAAAAVFSAGALSAAAFHTGLRADAPRLLDFLEGRPLQRTRKLMEIWLPFLTGCVTAVYAGWLLSLL